MREGPPVCEFHWVLWPRAQVISTCNVPHSMQHFRALSQRKAESVLVETHLRSIHLCCAVIGVHTESVTNMLPSGATQPSCQEQQRPTVPQDKDRNPTLLRGIPMTVRDILSEALQQQELLNERDKSLQPSGHWPSCCKYECSPSWTTNRALSMFIQFKPTRPFF